MNLAGPLPLLALGAWALALALAALRSSNSKKQQIAGGSLAGSIVASAFFGNGVGLSSVLGIGLDQILIAVSAGGLVLCWALLAESPTMMSTSRPVAPLAALALLVGALMAPRMLAGLPVAPVLFIAILQLTTSRSRRIEPRDFGIGLWVGLGLSLALGVVLELTVRVVGPEGVVEGAGYRVLLDLVGIEYRVGNALGGPAPFAFVAVIWMVMGRRYLANRTWVLVCAASLAVVLATAARSGLVFWVLAVGSLAFGGRAARSRSGRAWAGLLGGLSILVLAGSRLSPDQQEGLSTATGRVDLWNWIVEELLGGSGWYLGLGPWPASVGALGAPWDAAHAHSLYLAAWWTLGPLGLALAGYLVLQLLRDGKHLVGSERIQYFVMVSCFAVSSVQEPALMYGPTVGVGVMALVAMAVQSQTGSEESDVAQLRTLENGRVLAPAPRGQVVQSPSATVVTSSLRQSSLRKIEVV